MSDRVQSSIGHRDAFTNDLFGSNDHFDYFGKLIAKGSEHGHFKFSLNDLVNHPNGDAFSDEINLPFTYPSANGELALKNNQSTASVSNPRQAREYSEYPFMLPGFIPYFGIIILGSFEFSFTLDGQEYSDIFESLNEELQNDSGINPNIDTSDSFLIEYGVIVEELVDMSYNITFNIQAAIQAKDSITGEPSFGIAWYTENLPGGEDFHSIYYSPSSLNAALKQSLEKSPDSITAAAIESNQQLIIDRWFEQVAQPERSFTQWPPGDLAKSDGFDPIPSADVYTLDFF